ncbi:MAG: hypothetical protein ACKVP7_20690 [Hyphomicrobiaceae bacterium]
MPVDLMFILATLAFAWGLSLTTYRWFAVHNGWPMGEWQAHRPGLPIAIGLFCMAFAIVFGMARGGATVLIVPLFGVLCALAWTAITRIGAQSALLLAPLAVLTLLSLWYVAVTRIDYDIQRPALDRSLERPIAPAVGRPLDRFEDRAATPPALPVERTPPGPEVGRGIPTDRQPAPLPAPTR